MFSTIGVSNFYNENILSGNYRLKEKPEDFIVHEITENGMSIAAPLLDIEKYYESENTFKNLPESAEKDKRGFFYDKTNHYPFLKLSYEDGKFIVRKNKADIYVCTLVKYNISTASSIKLLAKYLGISPQYIQFSGNKDKRAVTYQEISVNCDFERLFDCAVRLKRKRDSMWKDVDFEKFSKVDELIIKVVEDTINTEKSNNTRVEEGINAKCVNNRSTENKTDLRTIFENKAIEIKNELVNNSLADQSIIEAYDVCDQLRICNIRKGHSIKMGEHIGNRFIIKIKGLEKLEKTPVYFYNYFGQQRFGNNLNNHIIGKYILEGKYDEALDMILNENKNFQYNNEKNNLEDSCEGNVNKECCIVEKNNSEDILIHNNVNDILNKKNNHGYNKKEYIKEKELKNMNENKLNTKESYDDDDNDHIFNQLQRFIIKMRKNGMKSKTIVYKMHRLSRMIYMHAYQSYIFNCDLNKRIINNSFFDGDTVLVNNKFVPASEGNKLEEIYIPLVKANDKFLKGSQRKMIEEIIDFESRKEDDGIVVSFSLKKSSYATIALREIIGNYCYNH